MQVWLVTVGEPLPMNGDSAIRLLRTGALARHLVERGHEVLWWTSAFDHFHKKHHCALDSTILWEGGTIRMLKSVGYRRNVSWRRFLEHAGVARKFRHEALALSPPDIVLASLPTIELAREAVVFGQTRSVPILVDVRDLWPDVLVNVVPPNLRWFSRGLLTSMTSDAVFALSRCNGIIGVSDGYLTWALRHAGRSKTANDAVFPLGYAAALSSGDQLNTAAIRLTSAGVDSSKKICWYVGSFGRQYDLAPVLNAAKSLRQSGRTDIQFVISGEGDLGSHWRQLAEGADNVIFTGWVNGHEINWLRGHACIGLQPYAKGAPQGLANKLFEYLSAGLPIVSSLLGENQQLIEQHGCGFTYRPGDDGECLQSIRTLLDDEPLRAQMGRNAEELFRRRFDSRSLLDAMADHLQTAALRYQNSRERLA